MARSDIESDTFCLQSQGFLTHDFDYAQDFSFEKPQGLYLKIQGIFSWY